MTRECLEECDDLILWFSEGQYVYQTMELKMQYKPLTPSQQEKYDRRYEKMSVSNETEEIPDLTQYQKTEAAGEKPDVQISDEPQGMKEDNTDSEVSKENDLAAQQSGKKKIGNTMKLDEALKSLLNIVIKAEDEPAGEPEPAEETDEDLTELESKIEAIESVADLGFAEKVAGIRKREATKVDPDLEELKPLPEEELEVDDEAQEQKDVKIQKAAESNGDQIQGQMSFMDILEGWGEPEAEVSEETAEDFAEEEAEVLEETAEDFVEEEAEVLEETAEDFVEEEAEVLEETAEDFVEEEAEVLEETAEEFVEEEADRKSVV